MKLKSLLYFFSLFLIVFTVPWMFVSTNYQSFYGLPYWAFYSILATFLYAIILAYFIHRYWKISASNEM